MVRSVPSRPRHILVGHSSWHSLIISAVRALLIGSVFLLVGLNSFLHKLDGLFGPSNAFDLKLFIALLVVGDKELLDLVKEV
jgi:hypothetical protein